MIANERSCKYSVQFNTLATMQILFCLKKKEKEYHLMLEEDILYLLTFFLSTLTKSFTFLTIF